MKIKANSLALLLLASCGAGLLFNAPGTGDVTTWLKWMESISSQGVVAAYASIQPHYPPFSFVLLDLAARGARLLNTSPFLAVKLSLLLFLELTGLVFYFKTRNLALTALLQAALTLNTMALGAIDIYYAPFLLLALFALARREWAWFGLWFTVSFLIKPQALILAPFALAYAVEAHSPRQLLEVKTWHALRALLALGLPAAAVVGLAWLVFGPALPLSITEAGADVHLSGNALNANWVLTYILHVTDPATYRPLAAGQVNPIKFAEGWVMLAPRVVFGLAYGAVLARFIVAAKTFRNLVAYALLGLVTYFMFNTGVHENHLFVAVLLGAILLHLEGSGPWFALAALASNLNLLAFYGIDGRGLPFGRVVGGLDVTVPMAGIYTLIYLLVVGQVARPGAERG